MVRQVLYKCKNFWVHMEAGFAGLLHLVPSLRIDGKETSGEQ